MDRRYVFRGNAVGVAGHIHRPEDSIIWVQGVSSLPVIGGYARSCIDRVKCGEVLSFDAIFTRATGDYSEKDKAFKTLANSVVKGLQVDGRLTADSLESTLAATHGENADESSITLSGTSITNLRIDGYPIDVTIDTDLCAKFTTRKSVTEAYTKNTDKLFDRYAKRFFLPQNQKPDQKRIPETGGYMVCSIVSEVRTAHPKVVVDGHILTLEGFGQIFLGELLIGSQSRRLTLLRLKLGSPIAGDIACSEVEGNGTIIL